MKVKAYFAFLLNTMSSNFFSVWGENLRIYEDRSGIGGSSDVFYRSIHVPVHNCCDEGGHRRQGRLKVKQRRARIALRFACWVLSWSSLLGAWSQNDWLLYIRDKTLTYLFRKNWICTGRSLEVHHGARSRLPFGVLPCFQEVQGHAARTSRKWHTSTELRNQWCEV